MDDVRAGLILRSLRRRARLRQIDLGRRTGISQQTVSRLERGDFDTFSLRTICAIFEKAGAEYRAEVRWRGAEVDRLLDDAHASLVGATATSLRTSGWDVALEVTFSRYGERGSIDVLGFHRATQALLVIEVKSSLASVEELLRRLDVKVRLAPRIAADVWGVRIDRASRLVILPATRTERRHVDRHHEVLSVALPILGRRTLAWLRSPEGMLAGIAFVPLTRGGSTSPVPGGRHRVDLHRIGSSRPS